eukprot:COSAG04_NODE_146_length_22922_cov_53.506901_20_plen_59_part_00
MTWRWMARQSERTQRPRRPADFNSSTPAARSRISRSTVPRSERYSFIEDFFFTSVAIW